MAKQKMKPAAIFLIIIAVIIVLILAGGIWLNADTNRVLRIAFTPGHAFSEETPDTARNYADDKSWAALPSNGSHATDKPDGVIDIAALPVTDVFFVHPTTYLKKAHWNAPDDAKRANQAVDQRSMKIHASAFNAAGLIFAPRYRQATLGAFFDQSGEGVKALGLAYTDVLAAFDNFIATRNQGRPFILAGHSQGSLHLLYLLQHRVSGTPLQKRMVAAYLIGWPVSIQEDLGALVDIGACTSSTETGCVVSYQTFGIGGNPASLKLYMENTTGLSGKPRKDSTMLCTNPLDWAIDSQADAAIHKGAVIRHHDAAAAIGPPQPQLTDAKCSDGILYVTTALSDAWQQYKMAGENYHPYDIPLFYMNIRENAAVRANSWSTSNINQENTP